MGRIKVVLIVGLVVVLVLSVLVGVLCGVGSATLNMVFHKIIADQISQVSNLIVISINVTGYGFTAMNCWIFIHSAALGKLFSYEVTKSWYSCIFLSL